MWPSNFFGPKMHENKKKKQKGKTLNVKAILLTGRRRTLFLWPHQNIKKRKFTVFSANCLK